MASINTSLALDDKQVKKLKKFHKKNPIQLTFVFSGPSIDENIQSLLKNELKTISVVNVKNTSLNIGDDCEYCKDVKIFFMAIGGQSVLTFQHYQAATNCLIPSGGIAPTPEDLDRLIFEELVRSKGKSNRIYVFIPGRKAAEYNEAVEDGWQEKVDLKSGKFEEKEVSNCVGETIKLYRKPPCDDPGSFKLMWPTSSTWSISDYNREITNVFPPSDVALRSIFLLYIPNICAESISFHFQRNENIVWSYTTRELQRSTEYPEYLEVEIPIDQVSQNSNEYFLYYCESAEVYKLTAEITQIDKSTTTKTLGQFSFIKCPK